MCASHTSGHQGFKSFSVQPCATLKPGETAEGRATKFASMGAHIVTPPSLPAHGRRVGRHSFESVAAQSTQAVQPCHYAPPSGGIGSNAGAMGTPRKFLGVSTYQLDFPDYGEQMRDLLAVDRTVFQEAFRAELADTRHLLCPRDPRDEPSYSSNNNNNNSVGSNSDTDAGIALEQVPRVVQRAMGDTASARLLELFETYFDHGLHTPVSMFRDQITWPAFCEAIDHFSGVFADQLAGQGRAAGGGGLGKSDSVRIIPASTPASSHHLDYGKYGDRPPIERPYVRRRGLASTTDDLQHGTFKDTFHMPGYMGFLPRTTHNPDAVAHAEGAVLRGRKDELRLYHSDNLHGYTGHKPVDCKNYRGECRAGSDDSTTTGSAYTPHM